MSYNLDRFANGELNRIVNAEIKRVFANIHDRETPADKPRKIILTLTFEADEYREEAVVSIDAKTKLVDKLTEGAVTKLKLTHEAQRAPKGQMSLEDFEDKPIVKDNNVIVLNGREL